MDCPYGACRCRPAATGNNLLTDVWIELLPIHFGDWFAHRHIGRSFLVTSHIAIPI